MINLRLCLFKVGHLNMEIGLDKNLYLRRNPWVAVQDTSFTLDTIHSTRPLVVSATHTESDIIVYYFGKLCISPVHRAGTRPSPRVVPENCY